jgi:hypothetical protein
MQKRLFDLFLHYFFTQTGAETGERGDLGEDFDAGGPQEN